MLRAAGRRVRSDLLDQPAPVRFHVGQAEGRVQPRSAAAGHGVQVHILAAVGLRSVRGRVYKDILPEAAAVRAASGAVRFLLHWERAGKAVEPSVQPGTGVRRRGGRLVRVLLPEHLKPAEPLPEQSG